MDLPSYKISMNVCLNGIPMEPGVWQRRPGTRHVAPARGGKTGKLIKFALAQTGNFAYQMEFTDGFLRFTTGPSLVMTNDQQAVVAISTANPAVVHTVFAHGWSNSDCIAFNSLGANNPALQNRQFVIGVVDATHFTIADAITGANIDGSTLECAFVSGNVTRVLQIVTILHQRLLGIAALSPGRTAHHAAQRHAAANTAGIIATEPNPVRDLLARAGRFH